MDNVFIFKSFQQRLRDEYGLDVFIGRPSVNYKETVTTMREHTYVLDEIIDDKNVQISVTLRIEHEKGWISSINIFIFPGAGALRHLRLMEQVKSGDNPLLHMQQYILRGLEIGVQMGADHGPLIAHQLIVGFVFIYFSFL